ncbi:MAG: serine hydroxymethyltransferase [Candidatus Doudnabacteria bacterium RIFCSPHIGHO2_01_FULL_50_11]|uniref:Serine hydroxymethyltransferase n=1 Tax=Candidatus Doudnabacteria bacterium RIFCSPHIGHO2_01_FULL_50_11 TaxID=1817828 RepID=A0A1F5PEN9_9BACT|nr:MAG: serine hydroxymethyltransferase [Candidatus Doudnabacteria bacterium RIFCSPHIGHO2_01_FULL_50_11]HLC44449.1 serine hydroxymethyltransferase [Patescibacteria group bacterium]
MSHLQETDPKIYEIIEREKKRQAEGLELIASENYVSPAVLEAMGSVLTNKYSEGYPGKRYYGGNDVIDEAESLAIDRAIQLFGAEHVNVQPLSGSPANLAVYMALLNPGDKVLGLSLDQGGHLSHGHPLNFSGKLYTIIPYLVRRDSEVIDMDEVEAIARREKPKMILAGFSAYSRSIDWKRFGEIADMVGALTFADIAHIAGLIAGKQLESPIPYFDVVSTTTHKTLRGPRGAIIMCKDKFAAAIDKAVFPGVQGGPHDHMTAAKAVAFGEALKPQFVDYSAQVIRNAQALSSGLQSRGYRIVSGGTDNHLMLVDVFGSKNISGKEAEKALERVGISINKNMIPYDPRKPLDPSGIRLGTPALTTRGAGVEDMETIANFIDEALENRASETNLKKIEGKVKDFSLKFPVPGIG